MPAWEEIGDNAVHFDTLRAIARGPVGLVPFVGAGLGIPYGLPGWAMLLRELGTTYRVRSEIEALLAASRFEEAADHLIRTAGREPVNARLKKVYGEAALAGRTLSGAVTRLPLLARGPVVTTNFDRLLERAFEAAGRPFAERLSGTQSYLFRESLDNGARYLLKLHGDILDSRNRVLTLAEYDQQYGGRDVAAIDFDLSLPKMLRAIFQSRSLLFVGCSLGPDRTLLLLRRVVAEQGELAPAHYALLEYPGDESWVERGRFLSDYRIFPIWYPTGRHELIDEILAALLPEAASSPPVPALTAEPTPTRGVGRVPWRIEPAAARRQLDSERPLLVLGPKQFGKTSYLQRLFAAGFTPGDAGHIVDLRNAEASFHRWLAVEIGRGVGLRAAETHAAWERTYDQFGPAQRLTDLLETVLLPRVAGRLALGFENPGELPASLDAELFGLLRRFSQYAREERSPDWRRLSVVVTTSTTPRAWERRLAQNGLRHESSFFDLARKHWLRDLDDVELPDALRRLVPDLDAGPLLPAIRDCVGGSPHLLGHLVSDAPDRETLARRLADPLRHAAELRALLEAVATRIEAHPGGAAALAHVAAGTEVAALDDEPLDLLYAEGLFVQDGTGAAERLYGVWKTFLTRRP